MGAHCMPGKAAVTSSDTSRCFPCMQFGGFASFLKSTRPGKVRGRPWLIKVLGQVCTCQGHECISCARWVHAAAPACMY